MMPILWALLALAVCACVSAVAVTLSGGGRWPRPRPLHPAGLDGGPMCDPWNTGDIADDPTGATCADCVGVVAAGRDTTEVDPSWWAPHDVRPGARRDIGQVSTRDMSHDTASPYPTAVEYRAGLSGHTITVERLDEDAARQWASPPDDIDRVAVIERMDGRFGTVRHVVQDAAADPDELAEVSALSLGARYVPAAVAR